MEGYLRSDGRKGIRNIVAVIYTVECSHHVATRIAAGMEDDVHVIGFGGCYPNNYAAMMLERLATHPNVGAVLLVSLGCEGFDRSELARRVAATGRPVHTLVVQHVRGAREGIRSVARVPMDLGDLVIGTICGGSDSTSGISANPAVGGAFDRLVAAGAITIFEETGELIGCEYRMAERAISPALGEELVAAVHKAEAYYKVLGHGSFAAGNAEGGLTTIEEKSLGAYAKSGHGPISGVIKPGDIPSHSGCYLLDVIPDGEVRWGFPNINDNAEAAELMACGAHMILFTTGRGSVVGSALAPIVKVCANPETYDRMAEDMDVNAGRVIRGEGTLDEVADEIVDLVRQVAGGRQTASEQMGHQEFVLTYKVFEPIGPACLPLVQVAPSPVAG
jgi:altronate hydrolase